MKNQGIFALMAVCGLASSAMADVQGLALGTLAPPTTIGGFTMTPFGLDSRYVTPTYATVNNVPSPRGGTVGFSTGLSLRRVGAGAGWASWSHGYTGDVYFRTTAGQTTLTMPANTGAFQLYAEPNPFAVHQITVTGTDGSTSAVIVRDVDGQGGAQGFGFYGTCCEQIASVKVDSAEAYAIGEFAIALSGGITGTKLGTTTPGGHVDVLVLDGGSQNDVGQTAAANLGFHVTTVTTEADFVTEINNGTYEMAVWDVPSLSGTMTAAKPALINFINNGGRALVSFWNLDANADLQAALDVTGTSEITAPAKINSWATTNRVWTTPHIMTSVNVDPAAGDPWGDNGDELSWSPLLTSALGGSTVASSAGNAFVVRGNFGRTMCIGRELDTFFVTQATDFVENCLWDLWATGLEIGDLRMTPFPTDTRTLGAGVTSVPSPLGSSITFDKSLIHHRVGTGWSTWSNNYQGDVYFTNGANDVRLTMPPNTSGFYLYVEPNPFAVHTISATARDGSVNTVLSQAVQGDSGAYGYFFRAHGCNDLVTIDVSCPTADFAIGEFGINERMNLRASALGTSAPPSTLGGFAMTKFPSSSAGASVSSVPSPLGGSVVFNQTMTHFKIGAGWAGWSHGYTGDVYWTGTGDMSVAMTMPANTNAFILYAEPNPFADHVISAVCDDGSTLSQTVNGSMGAKGYGFWGLAGKTIRTITVSSPTTDFAVGEFSIATCAKACFADCNGDGKLDVQDFTCFQNAFALGQLSKADCNGDGKLDITDFTCFQNKFALGCP